MKKLLLALLLPLLTGCASTQSTCDAGIPLLNASLWVQSAAEYDAAAQQTYNTAKRMLDAALAQAPGPAAVILDLDETALDNSAFETRMIRSRVSYDAAQWKGWTSESKALAVPGASEFLQYARSRGVTPFYITNRMSDEEAGTRRNLETLGFPFTPGEDTLLTRGERPEWKPGDKGPRRDYVASRYRVLLLIGDDLNDFVPAAEATVEQRDAMVRSNAAKWGTEWLIVPNPMYGSWEKALTRGTKDECAALQKKLDAMR